MNVKPLLHAVAATCALFCVTGCTIEYMKPKGPGVAQRPPEPPATEEANPDVAVAVQAPREAPTDEELQTKLVDEAGGHWVEDDGVRCWVPAEPAATGIAVAGGPTSGNEGEGTTQPTTSTGANGQRPYTNGQWLKTDAGLTWQSHDAGGDITSHFGNWYQSPTYGWVWRQGTVWAPAWVTWNEGGDYCGWAPLPPLGVAVVVDPAAFVFVDRRYVTSAHVFSYIRPARENVHIYSLTREVGRTRIDPATHRGSTHTIGHGINFTKSVGKTVKVPKQPPRRPKPPVKPPRPPVHPPRGGSAYR